MAKLLPRTFLLDTTGIVWFFLETSTPSPSSLGLVGGRLGAGFLRRHIDSNQKRLVTNGENVKKRSRAGGREWMVTTGKYC